MELPNYRTDPGFPSDLTDIIQAPSNPTPNDARAIRWISSYQGEVDYTNPCGEGRLSFRYAKVPWRWSWLKEGQRYWNFETEGEFQSEINGSWGILHRGGNPVNQKTLDLFRSLYHPEAVTGYWDHERKQWVICEPTDRELSTESWKRTQHYRDFCAERGLAA